MKTSTTIVALMWIVVSPLHAQLVNDGATNTLSNVTNSFTGSVTVGTNGSFTLLILSDNALLTNSVNGTIGLNATARSNEVRLISPTARWRMGNTLIAGDNGAFNQLAISNGALVANSSGFVGASAANSNNTVVVSGSGSVWSNSASLSVGQSGVSNQLIIADGGRVLSSDGRLGSVGAGTRAVVTGGGSLWENQTQFFVGVSGTENQLWIENGGWVGNGPGVIGANSGSVSNEVVVTGASSTWSNRQDLHVGQNGDFNRLVLSNGGRVINSNGIVGANAVATDNEAVITGSNSLWSNRLHLVVGFNGSGNRVTVREGGVTFVTGDAVVGLNASATSNSLVLTDPGTRFLKGLNTDLIIGSNSPFNRLVISNGAVAECRIGETGYATGGDSNEVVVTDAGSVWFTGLNTMVGRNGSGNRLTISNGATVMSANGVLGLNAGGSNNVAIVTGPGSHWSNRVDFLVGNIAGGNRLVISNGGTVTVSNVVYIGATVSSTGNRLVVDGGTLRATNDLVNGTLDVGRGTNVLNAGLIEVDQLMRTNTLGFFEFNGGTLAVKNSDVRNGAVFRVGDGVTPATLSCVNHGLHIFGPTGLILSSNSTLTGSGNIAGSVVVQPGAAVSPGAPIGRLFLQSSMPATIQGTAQMELSKNGSVLTNDVIQKAGALSFAGPLVVSHLGPTALAAGDRFRLFDAGGYFGAFSSISLPPLSPGLIWINNLFVDGSIEVFENPPTGGFALGFDGTNDFVITSNDSRFNAYPLIVTAWINTTQTTGEVGIINKYVAGSLNGWHVGLLDGQVRAWYLRDNANRVGSDGAGLNGGFVSDGGWHHVAFTVDGNGGRLFVDGFLRDAVAWFGTPGACTTTQELRLGHYPGGAGEFFKGALDETAVWGFVEQSASEIQTNLNRGRLGSESGLLIYHRYTEGSGTFARNAAGGTGDNGSAFLQNGVAWVPGLILRPAIATTFATGVSVNAATLHGQTNPGLTNTSAWFEWGTTAAYGNVTPAQFLGKGTDNTNFTHSLTGLVENVAYHFRAVASNGVGVSYGIDKSFVTTGTNMLTPRVHHTSTLLPDGKVLVAGGRDQDQNPVASAELFDPVTGTWAFTKPMNAVRYHHTATMLPNGKVLVVGGLGADFSPGNSSAELYDPSTGTWKPTTAMAANRFYHTATLLPDGRVLIAGGCRGDICDDATSDVYDPETESWTSTGTMLVRRTGHIAALLPDGKVLVAGGRDSNSVPIAVAELYDPISGIWTNTASMTTNRAGHTATLLRNGKVMVVGGFSGTTSLRTAELYNHVAGTWTATGAMLNFRVNHTATLLANGHVLASGGGIGVPSVYNPVTEAWTDVPGPDPQSGAAATLLLNGNVLVTGGFFLGSPIANAPIYAAPNIASWTATAPLAQARDGHTATLLPNGQVLVASFTNAEIYNPATGTWSNTAPLNSGRNNHTATLLPNGKVLVAGGINFVNLPGVELYDLTTGTWSNTAPLITNRISGHRATLLRNGRVLVTGGNGELFGPPLRNAELYDGATGTWVNAGWMTTNRSGHSATLLPDGKVLVAGGYFTGGFFPSVTPTAELYDPLTGLWTAIPSMSTNRVGHIAVLLPTGKVLVAGGAVASLLGETGSAELYDPATGAWKMTGSMVVGRSGATATLLPNGKVLVAAGYNGGYLSSAELYDPMTGKWTATASLGAAHNSHTATLLPTGRVLVTGGNFGSGITNRAELYDVGLGFDNSWRPQITTLTTTLTLGNGLAMTGAQFRGLSEASGGSAPQNSPTDYPIVQVRNLETQETVFALPSDWSTNHFTSLPVSGLSVGWAMATVFVSGIPSESRLLSLAKPMAMVTLSNLLQFFDGTAKSVSVTTSPPGLPVSVTYNGSPDAPTNLGSYTVVATILDQSYESSPATNTLIIAPVRDLGVDVSHFQNESGVPQASWDQMFAEGKRFVFIKATEGLTGPHDPTMAINVQRAAAAGLLVGVYHFAHPENRPTTNGAILEASNMVVYAGSAIGPGRLRPVLDLEFNAAMLSTAALTDWAIAFCNEIIARRGPSAAPIIYCNQTFANNELDSRVADYDLWLRTVGSGANPVFDDPPGIGFADATGVFNNWSFWQYSATGSSGGISPLDLNVCHSEFKPLESFLITNVVPTTIQLTAPSVTPDGLFQFSFTNAPGASFTVLTTTNAALPLSAWTALGGITEIAPGQFRFTDTQSTNHPQRYYRLRWP